MNVLYVFEAVAMAATIYILYLLVKEIKKSIKDSNDGKSSGKCDLD